MSLSPAVDQLDLAVRLRSRRLDLKLTTDAVAIQLGFSRNYWSSVENGRAVLARAKLEELLPYFQFDDEESNELFVLHDGCKQPRWWTSYSNLIADDDVLQSVGLETGASAVWNYESLVVPGLLQTREYAEAVIGADARTSSSTVKRRWEFRSRRQQRLRGENPLRLTALVSEAVLMQHFGTQSVLRNQLSFLSQTIDELADSLEVRVLPFDRSPLGLTGASTLMLLEFESPHLPTIAWREAVTPIGLDDDPDEVETLKVSFDQALEKASLSREDSLRLIDSKVASF